MKSLNDIVSIHMFETPQIDIEIPKYRKPNPESIKGYKMQISNENYTNNMVLIAIDGRKAICVPFSTGLVELMAKAQIVSIDRTWDGPIKSVDRVEGKLDISIINADLITPLGGSRKDKLEKLAAVKAKLAAEQEAIDKELSALNND